MGRTGWVDAHGGVTGDMWLGAVVGAGASLEAIEQAVATLGIGDVRVSYARVRRGGRDAVSVRVRPPEHTPRVQTVRQVRALLTFAALDEAVRERALAVFDRLAGAVAHGAGVEVDDLLFHEVGMLDDLAAIVGTCVGLNHLEVDRLLAGPVGVHADADPDDANANAIAHLLRDHVTRPLASARAPITTVGAALVAALTEPVDEIPTLDIIATGVGAAPRELIGTGLLHLTIGTPSQAAAGA